VTSADPLPVSVVDDQLRVGDRFGVAFQRTLRVPVDGRDYPLPPGFGRFPVRPIAGVGLAIPLYQREALWLAFDGADWKPNALQIGVGGVNVVSGGPWDAALTAQPQNYVVVPHQLWLDGINAGDGVVRQFVAVPLGSGLTVEAQVTGREQVGAIQFRVFEPHPGRFPDRPPARTGEPPAGVRMSGAMGVAAGGTVRQRIHPDPWGVETWDLSSATAVAVHLLNSQQWEAVTGERPPSTPIDAATYTAHGFPWFELYDETRGDVAAPDTLRRIEPLSEDLDSEPLDVDPGQIRRIEPDPED
jgi:hypothetical protein